MQLFSGYTSMFHHSAMEQGGVAYMAHIGGFFAGVILTFVFRSRQAQRGVIHRLGMSDNS
jgi:membrane associated rhomboid family serine protease